MKRLPQMLRGNLKPPSQNRKQNRVTGRVSGDTVTIRLDDVIDDYGGWWGISSKEFGQLLDSLEDDVTQIILIVNSPGGIAHEGVAIANELRNHPAKVTAYVTGLAASAATYAVVGADETVMCPGSELMIHDASTIIWGQAADLRHEANVLDKLSLNIAGIYAEAAGGTADEWRELMLAETWYTAQEAVDAGLAQRVGSIPAGTGAAGGSDDDVAADEDAPFGGSDITDRWDLSLFTYAGRANAPAPSRPNGSPTTPPPASADGPTPPTTEGATLVDFTDEQIATLRTQVGFADNADASTITDAIVEALGERADTRPSNDSRPRVPEGMTLIETDVLNQLQTGAQAGVEARTQQRTDARDRALDAAVNTGRITPARRDHWQTNWDADPEGTRELLDSLPKGFAVPLDEVGHADDTEPASNTVEAARSDDAYKNWSL